MPKKLTTFGFISRAKEIHGRRYDYSCVNYEEMTKLEEAAGFLHVHPITLQQKAKTGVIPGTKIGRRWVFIDVDLLQYIRSQYQPRALQGEKEKSECHFINAKTVPTGGSNSPSTDEEYRKALGL